MEDDLDIRQSGETKKFVWPESLDQILRDGARRGRKGSRVAIQKVLDSVPALTRAAIQSRIRKLKNPPGRPRYQRTRWTPELDDILRRGYSQGWSGKRTATSEILKRHPDWARHVVWRRAVKLGLTGGNANSCQSVKALPWSSNEDRTLLDHAGYDLAAVIGELLNRSANAVRCRLSRLRASGKVSDGYTRKSLGTFLHVSPRVVLRWIMLGWLKVRDPRITMASLETFSKTHASELTLEEQKSLILGSPDPRRGYTWARVAKHFRVNLETVQDWISRGWLKFRDPHITDLSFEDFCRKHGSEINYDLLGKDEQIWLVESMGLVRQQKNDECNKVRAICKQALTVRSCPGCRRHIRGNGFFRHIKACPDLTPKPKPRDSKSSAQSRHR